MTAREPCYPAPMRVGFDVSPLSRPCSPGVVRVVHSVLDALEHRGNLEVVRLAPQPGVPLRRWRQSELPACAVRLGLDGLHSFTSAFALRASVPRIQTIHELPWRHGVKENAGLAHRFWAAVGPLIAERVLVPSECTARDLRRRLLPGKDRIRVVPWGVGVADGAGSDAGGPVFADEPPPGVVDEVMLERYRLSDDPFVLCLGSVRPKKNLAAVLRGLATVVQQGIELRIVVSGGDTPTLRRDLGLAAALGLSRHVSTPETIEDADLPALLRLATCVPVLSRSEGFGLPVLEALASGTPVLVPPASAAAEVAGEAGLVVDPDDPAAVGAGLLRALREREELRPALIRRAAEFPWSRTALAIEQLWDELA